MLYAILMKTAHLNLISIIFYHYLAYYDVYMK